MIRVVIPRNRARGDLVDAFEYLGRSDTRIGDRFLAAADRTLQLVANFPEMGVAVPTKNPDLNNLRRIKVRGFKHYLLFYIPGDATIDLVRVLHGSRDTRAILEAE